MTITIGTSFTLEISARHFYARLPWIGEAFLDFRHISWSCCDRA